MDLHLPRQSAALRSDAARCFSVVHACVWRCPSPHSPSIATLLCKTLTRAVMLTVLAPLSLAAGVSALALVSVQLCVRPTAISG